MAGFGGSTGVSKGYVDGAIAQSTAAVIKSARVTATTSATGAVAIPSAAIGRLLNAIKDDGVPGLVFARDGGYVTVYDNNLNLLANTSVAILFLYY